jgi:tRNA(Ile)-lysidine synthase
MTPAAVRERAASVSVPTPTVLAVSGGADSMVMAALLVERDPSLVAAIATFDHGTGTAARASAELVAEWAAARGLAFRVGRASGLRRTEAAWRQARWAFLRDVAGEFGAPVATAHTRDDQIETVFIRLLRGSGVRGLAGLQAPGPIRRPLLHLARATVRAIAARCGVPFHDDPSNDDRRHLRNRVRLEMLPTLERATPGFGDWLFDVGQRAADWRADLTEAVDRFWAPNVQEGGTTVLVPRDRGRLPTAEEAALFWPEVAGRVGVVLDWRGTARLASFTTKESTGHSMPLSGGVVVRSERSRWTLERAGASAHSAAPPIGWHHAATD